MKIEQCLKSCASANPLFVLGDPIGNVLVAKIARGAVKSLGNFAELGSEFSAGLERLVDVFLLAHPVELSARHVKASDFWSNLVTPCITHLSDVSNFLSNIPETPSANWGSSL